MPIGSTEGPHAGNLWLAPRLRDGDVLCQFMSISVVSCFDDVGGVWVM